MAADFPPDPAVEVVELLADPFTHRGQATAELAAGFAAGPRRKQERDGRPDGRPDDRADQEAQAETGTRGSSLFRVL